ncbi:hypothetical protein [Micromonospora sp. NPDC005652]|uniref:hypothetical protein n=1 Tax=Micromonospora sp. NPDC005652 TaxID=3157046 RepID=UPI0033FE37F1
MGWDRVVKEIDHGTRVVSGVEVRIEEERWRSGGSSFSVYRVDNGADLTQSVYGQCFDGPPTDDEIAGLLASWNDGDYDRGRLGAGFLAATGGTCAHCSARVDRNADGLLADVRGRTTCPGDVDRHALPQD